MKDIPALGAGFTVCREVSLGFQTIRSEKMGDRSYRLKPLVIIIRANRRFVFFPGFFTPAESCSHPNLIWFAVPGKNSSRRF